MCKMKFPGSAKHYHQLILNCNVKTKVEQKHLDWEGKGFNQGLCTHSGSTKFVYSAEPCS